MTLIRLQYIPTPGPGSTVLINAVEHLYEGNFRLLYTVAAGHVAKGHNQKLASIQPYYNSVSVRILELTAARTGFAQEMTFMTIRLFKIACLAVRRQIILD